MEEATRPKKLMSMLGEEEDKEDSWSNETSSYVSDSIDGAHSKGEDSLDSRGKRAFSDDASGSSIFRPFHRKKVEAEKEKEIKVEVDKEKEKVEAEKEKEIKVEDPVNPDDYPELAKFVKLRLLGEEAQRNWTLIGNENAAMLEKKWIHIRDKQIRLSIWKTDLIQDIFSFFTDDSS